MGFFGKILEKLGLKKGEEAAKPAAAAPAPSTIRPMTVKPGIKPATPATAVKPATGTAYTPSSSSSMPPKPVVAAVSAVDVVQKLEKLSLGKGLDWKVSIVDLLKLLEIDSSRDARNELATELGCPTDLMKDSAKMNVWLHKEVLKKIAENGGNIPQSMLD